MSFHISIAALLMAMSSLTAQTLSTPVQCAQDSQGNQVCVGTQPNRNACGCLDLFADCHAMLVYCHDVVVQKTSPDGHTLYTRTLGGESDQLPRQFVFDAQDNVVLFGTTYSKQFPTTPDAVQPNFAGPAAAFSYDGSTPSPGGDIFLSILAPSGGLLYSTFVGSSGNDTVLGVRAASNAQVDLLAAAGASDFLNAPAGVGTPGGPVLLTFDLNSRTLASSGYLPIVAPGTFVAYFASIQDDGTVDVTTRGGLYTFGRDGQQRTFVSLESFAFAGLPGVSTDPAGDVWLVGYTTSRQLLVAKLIAGTVEAFRWALPVVVDGQLYSTSLLLPPFFGPDGLTYLGGSTYFSGAGDAGRLLSTTPNALLQTPCSSYSAGILAVLSAQGEVKLLSYLSAQAKSFAANPDGGVSVVLSDGRDTRIPIDLSQRPKAACVADADLLDRVSTPPPALGVGEVVRLRGAGFGPDSPVTVTPGADGHFPMSLGALHVEVAGIAAPILSAAPGEVVFAIPFETPDGDAIPVSVQDRGQVSAAFPIPVRAATPWLAGPILNADGTPNGFIAAPAGWGSTVTLFVTGAGPYSPPLDDGQVAPNDTLHRLQLPVSVSFLIAGSNPEPGIVTYAGPAPGFVGLAQIDIQLPASRPVPPYFSSIDPLLTIGPISVFLPSISVQ